MFKLLVLVFAVLFAVAMAAPGPDAKPQFAYGAYPYASYGAYGAYGAYPYAGYSGYVGYV